MKYAVRINKKLRYLRTYAIIKRVDRKDNFLTKMFIKILGRKGGEKAQAA
jgi:hypothetical protein